MLTAVRRVAPSRAPNGSYIAVDEASDRPANIESLIGGYVHEDNQ